MSVVICMNLSILFYLEWTFLNKTCGHLSTHKKNHNFILIVPDFIIEFIKNIFVL